MIVIIYGLIIIVATTLGAFVGLGGGVIIKPILDLIGHDTIDVVNFISSCSVFSMSSTSPSGNSLPAVIAAESPAGPAPAIMTS